MKLSWFQWSKKQIPNTQDILRVNIWIKQDTGVSGKFSTLFKSHILPEDDVEIKSKIQSLNLCLVYS